MGKINVYFPDDLEAEAREAGVKISPVCQEAVRAEVERIRRVSKSQPEVADVAHRLLQSKDDQDRQELHDGYEAGADWARTRATYRDLQRLSSYFGGRWGRIDVENYDTIQGYLFSRARSEGYDDAEPDWFDTLVEKSSFDRGFLAGAKDVYEQVRSVVFEEGKAT